MSLLTLLGTGTCQIEHERRASSVLLELDGLPILFDCGHGVAQRLLEAGVRHDRLEHVVLSHFHTDHISDLLPLLQAGAWSRRDPRSTDLHIYGPPGVRRLINGLSQLLGSDALSQPHYQVVVHEIAEGNFRIGPHIFEAHSLPPAGNQGLCFTWNNRRYALTGDSHFHAQEIRFLTGVDLAVIDAGHISDEEIVELAATTQVRTIVCSHLYRALDARLLQAQANARGYTGTILIGKDLQSFVL
jgi:ribonuclease BN (tRNA processing enzyme)